MVNFIISKTKEMSPRQTLVQMLKFGAKRWRVIEASEEENIRAPKRLCEPVNSDPANAV